jgi:DNA transformation protein and related proteins
MSVSSDYLEYVLDQLNGVGPLTSKRMFGGVCIFWRRLAFGVIASDVLYLKVDDSNRAEYLSADMKAFQPFADKPMVMSYFEVPIDILEDRESLREWANKAIAVAQKANKKK